MCVKIKLFLVLFSEIFRPLICVRSPADWRSWISALKRTIAFTRHFCNIIATASPNWDTRFKHDTSFARQYSVSKNLMVSLMLLLGSVHVELCFWLSVVLFQIDWWLSSTTTWVCMRISMALPRCPATKTMAPCGSTPIESRNYCFKRKWITWRWKLLLRSESTDNGDIKKLCNLNRISSCEFERQAFKRFQKCEVKCTCEFRSTCI